MGRHRPGRVVKIVVLVLAGIALVSAVVMGLWNALLPPLFGWHSISFWQALGLLVLSRLLFGRIGRPGGGGGAWKRAVLQRWAQMTPEERAQMSSHWRQHGCFSGAGGEKTPGEGQTPPA